MVSRYTIGLSFCFLISNMSTGTYAQKPVAPVGNVVSNKAVIRVYNIDTTNQVLKKAILQHVSGLNEAPDMTNTTLAPPNGIKWSRSFGGIEVDYINTVIALPDSGFIVSGTTYSQDGDIIISSSNFNAFISRFDKDGRVKWIKGFGGIRPDEELVSVIRTSDNNFLATGYTDVGNGLTHAFYEGWVVKFNGDGDTLWTKKYGGRGDESFGKVCELPDGSFMIAGHTNSTNTGDVTGYIQPHPTMGNQNIWLVKIDNMGQLLWQKCIADSLSSYSGGEIKYTNDNHIVIAGNIRPYYYPGITLMAYVAKLDTAGNFIWQKKFSLPDWNFIVSSIVVNDDNSIMMLGSGELSGNKPDTFFIGLHGSRDIWTAKLNANGNMLWQKFLGGTNYDFGSKINRTVLGNYLLTGSARSNDGNLSGHYGSQLPADGWIVEIDSLGNLLWQKNIGGSQSDNLVSSTELLDGNIIAVGQTATEADGDVHGGHGMIDGLLVNISRANLIQGQAFVDKNDNAVKDTDEPFFSNGSVSVEKSPVTSATALKRGTLSFKRR